MSTSASCFGYFYIKYLFSDFFVDMKNTIKKIILQRKIHYILVTLMLHQFGKNKKHCVSVTLMWLCAFHFPRWNDAGSKNFPVGEPKPKEVL